MAPSLVTLQSDLTLKERAVRHLVGEVAAGKDAEARLQAEIEMTRARLAAAKAPVTTGGTIPSGDRFPDLSSYQAPVDLATVRADSAIKLGQLIVMKATEGTFYTDGYFVSRWAAAAAAGFPHRGAYHFLHMNESGTAQAEYFLNEIHRAGADAPKAQDIVICDAEVSDGASPATVAQAVAEFGGVLMANCPAKRWLYVGGPFAVENGIRLAPYDGHWLPAYVADPKSYYVFGTPISWQFTDGVHGPTPHVAEGIGPCDLSIIL